MEPVTMAIMAAITAGVAKGAADVGENLLTDAYAALKALLRRRFGDRSDLAKAVDELETRPASTARQQVLAEEVAASGADRDPELLAAATALLAQLQAQPGGGAHVQHAVGNYIAQADRAGRAEVNVNRAPDQPTR